MATINFNTATRLSPASTAFVYTRETWAGEWVERPEIHAEQCAWTIAPEVATATLRRPFGRVLLPGGTAAADRTRIDLRGHFVRIDWETGDTVAPAQWLGYVESPVDEPFGNASGSTPLSGEQLFFCYGLEKSLMAAPIRDTVWRDNAGAGVVRGGTPIGFNAGGRPNRSAAMHSGSYVFEPNEADAESWSSRDIIGYLLNWHLPTNSGGVAVLPWALTNAAIVPDWDAPVVDADGADIYSILSTLLSYRMLLSWTVAWNTTNLLIVPFSLTPTAITLESVTFPANAVTHSILFDADPLSRGAISEDGTERVDQVIVRGARRVSVCTLDVASGNLPADWTEADRDAYDAGASGDAGYADLDVFEQRRRNAAVRQSRELAATYRRFRIPDDWDAEVAGDGGTEDVFIVDGDTPTKHRPYPMAIALRTDCALLERKDYAGAVTADDPADRWRIRRPPIAILASPDGGFREVQTIGRADAAAGIEPAWSVNTIVDGDRTLSLEVSGGPQHMIASGPSVDDFLPLPADSDEETGYSVQSLKATVAIQEDRHAEAAWPVSPATADVVRRRVVYVGDRYELVRIVPHTIVGVDAAGATKHSSGGYLRDDRAQLLSLAKLLAAFHTVPRLQMTLVTQRRTGILTVGSMITSVGTAYPTAINALVAKIEIWNPESLGPTQGAQQRITAATAPVDLMTTLALIRSGNRG